MKVAKKSFENILYRAIPALCTIIFSFLFVKRLVTPPVESDFVNWIYLSTDVLSLICSIILLINPKLMAIYGFASIFYAVILCFDKDKGVLMALAYTVSIVFFWQQGFLKKKSKLKLFFSLLSFIALVTFRSFYCNENFFTKLIAFLPYFVAILILFLFVINSEHIKLSYKAKKIINLDEIDDLSNRDKKLIIAILNNESFAKFGEENNISPSVIKKDAIRIYQYFGVSSKLSFCAKYSDYSFILDNKTVFN